MNPSRRGTPDFVLFVLTFVLVGFGIVMVFSASSATAAADIGDKLYFTKRQLIYAGIGAIGLMTAMNIHYSKFRKWYFMLFVIVVGLLIFVLFRPAIKGARSWLMIGSFGIQPSEFAKLTIILYIGALISKKGEKFREFKRGLLPVIVIVGFVAFLIALERDFGSCIIFLTCAFIVIVAGGANFKHLTTMFVGSGTFLLFLTGAYLLVKQDAGYRGSRFSCFFNPWSDVKDSCFQQIQSLYAFGHGGLTGAGFGRSIQKLHYLPEAHNDFIFAIIGEELGFIGSTIFLFVYLVLIWRGLIVALRCPDLFGTLVGIGIVGMIGFQAFINIGGVTGAIPMTGVTLPFISAGGSSLIVSMTAMGVLLSISRENRVPEIHEKRKPISTARR